MVTVLKLAMSSFNTSMRILYFKRLVFQEKCSEYIKFLFLLMNPWHLIFLDIHKSLYMSWISFFYQKWKTAKQIHYKNVICRYFHDYSLTIARTVYHSSFLFELLKIEVVLHSKLFRKVRSCDINKVTPKLTPEYYVTWNIHTHEMFASKTLELPRIEQ